MLSHIRVCIWYHNSVVRHNLNTTWGVHWTKEGNFCTDKLLFSVSFHSFHSCVLTVRGKCRKIPHINMIGRAEASVESADVLRATVCRRRRLMWLSFHMLCCTSEKLWSSESLTNFTSEYLFCNHDSFILSVCWVEAFHHLYAGRKNEWKSSAKEETAESETENWKVKVVITEKFAVLWS
jgi:hypothetical protein